MAAKQDTKALDKDTDNSMIHDTNPTGNELNTETLTIVISW